MSRQLHDVPMPRERIIVNAESRRCIEMGPSRTREIEVLLPWRTLQIAHSTNDPLISIACLTDTQNALQCIEIAIEMFEIDLEFVESNSQLPALNSRV